MFFVNYFAKKARFFLYYVTALETRSYGGGKYFLDFMYHEITIMKTLGQIYGVVGIWICLLCLGFQQRAYADSGFEYEHYSDTAKVMTLVRSANAEIGKNNLDQAIVFAQQAAIAALETRYMEGRITSLMLLGRAYKLKNDLPNAQKHYFEALDVASDMPNYNFGNLYSEIGLLYRDFGITAKAIEYFTKAIPLVDTQQERTNLLRYIAFAHVELRDYPNALDYYLQLLEIYKKGNNKNSTVLTLRNIADIYSNLAQHDNALFYNKEILQIKKEMGDQEGVANYLNSIGYLYEKMRQYQPALEHFQQALELNRGLKKPEGENIVILRNIGVMYQYLGNYEKALEYFYEAYTIATKNNDSKEAAASCNYIATIHLGLGDFKKAEEYTLKAIELNQKINAKDILARSYKRLSEIYERTAKNQKALKYYRMSSLLMDSIKAENINELQTKLQKIAQVEDLEKQTKELAVEAQLSRAQAQTYKLEAEKKERDLEIMMRDQQMREMELQRSEVEKQQTLQSALLAKKDLETKVLDEKNRVLQGESELQRLEISQKEMAESQYQKEIDQSRKDKEFLQRLAEDEKKIRTYYDAIIILFALILVLILISYYFRRKANIQLRRQKTEIEAQRDAIEEKNKVLNLQQSEILQQNTVLEEQKGKLVTQKEEVEKSYNNMAIISEIGQEITANLDLSYIMNTVYEHVSGLMSSDKFGIGLVDEKAQILEYGIYMESGRPKAHSKIDLREERFASWVVHQKKPLFMNDIRGEYIQYIRHLNAYKSERLSNAIICLPLTIKDSVIGLINVQSFTLNAYSQYELDMLQTLASYVSIAIYNSKVYQDLKGANAIINETNRHITDSIRYAQTIQEAVLPTNEKMSGVLKEHFVIFKPKDIVSGDFYWFSYIDDKAFLAVVDCTGHGVPGAFMSMVGNDLLDEIVNLERVNDPAEVLRLLHQGIFRTLKQEEGKNDDGMDVCLCKIEYNISEEENKVLVSFAGAKRPLFYSHNGEIHEAKGNITSIGGNNKRHSIKHFDSHPIWLQKDDVIYLSTDGLIDQNNNLREKYGTLRFKELLGKVFMRDMRTQQIILNNEFDLHKSQEPQRDDVTILGVRL